MDTHVWIWALTAPERLGSATMQMISNSRRLCISSASIWELALKQVKGKLVLPAAIPDMISASGVEVIDIDWPSMLASCELEPIHKDPFDRVIVATAVKHQLAIVTADADVRAYQVAAYDAAL